MYSMELIPTNHTRCAPSQNLQWKNRAYDSHRCENRIQFKWKSKWFSKDPVWGNKMFKQTYGRWHLPCTIINSLSNLNGNSSSSSVGGLLCHNLYVNIHLDKDLVYWWALRVLHQATMQHHITSPHYIFVHWPFLTLARIAPLSVNFVSE